MENRFKIVFIAGIILLQTACSFHVPANRGEFVDIVKQGKGPTKYESVVVDSSLKSLVNHLHKKSSECFNKIVKRSMTSGYYAQSSETYYNPALKYITKTKADFTLQVEKVPGSSKQPEKGLYVMALDLIALDHSRTRLHVYKPTYIYNKIGDAIQQWAMGQNTPCPELR